MRSFVIASIALSLLLLPTGAQDLWETTEEASGYDHLMPARAAAAYKLPEVYNWAVGENGLILLSKNAAGTANRFMVVGALHHTSPAQDFTMTLLNELSQAAIQEEVDFVFFAGDLGIETFQSTSEEQSVLKDWRFVLESLQDQNIKLYACRGTHESDKLLSWNILFSGSWGFPQNGPATEKNITYAVEYDNLLFVVLDQYTHEHRINQVWLDSVLTATSSEHIFVAGHEPAFKLAYTNCLSMYHCDRDAFWESLAEAGVDAYFCGQDHFYDHAIIYDGDINPGGDLHHLTVGTGGGTLHADGEYDGNNGGWKPGRLFHEKEYGYVLVEIEGGEVKMTWKRRIGQNMFVDGGDSFLVSAGENTPQQLTPGNAHLSNYPNPFQSGTNISYHLSEYCHVELSVYDQLGRKVSTLVNENQPSGKHVIEWNPAGLKTGVYLCVLRAQDRIETHKMFVIP